MAIIDTSEVTEKISHGINSVIVDALQFGQMHPIAGTLLLLLGALLGKIATDWK